ncbi:hypothetical protein LSTR_LSTR017307 [Laodelphax striatellus]|uniref:C2H2-type domain-containing protein n=1 Tax=Laodelphax striatellus TaxID=195883 RepID=A0A482XRJ3_LAOST|nr:hypothetical protein LSTR_LSTR017307 [Laodelphax striatellus]
MMPAAASAERDGDASGGESNASEPPTKTRKVGKAYPCPHCSYGAEKKVSLNRHMRMHSASPATQSNSSAAADPEPTATATATATSPHLVDRYCQDCDIRFSSLKTFRAHKMHYCSTRHVIKVNSKPPSAPPSPSDSMTTPTSPGASDTSAHREPQTFFALPTNPILIVPYSLFQRATAISGIAGMGLPRAAAASQVTSASTT